jgi:OmpA-OmpF porin, OOP family
MVLGLALYAMAASIQSPSAASCPIVENFTLVPFDSGSADLSAQARLLLDNWSEIIRSQRFPAEVELVGGADRVGTRRANLRLSFRRAYAVRAYLVGHGVRRQRVRIRAFGEDHPLVDTADEVPEAQNRLLQLLMVPDAREPRPC